MSEFLRDPVFYWLLCTIFMVIGTIIGWSLRANYPEKDVRRALERSEHDRSVLARLYTHLKHQHDLREADFKRASLELENMREHLLVLEQERIAHINAEQLNAIRVEQAEANAARFAERFRAIEEQANALRSRNAQLTAELGKMQAELNAWKTLYRDFQAMQQKIHLVEQTSATLEAERNQLRQQLEIAHAEIEHLQNTRSSKRNARKGGPARSTPGPDNPDDLKIIKGINLSTEQQLQGLGVFTYSQISHWDDEDIISAAKKLGISPGKIYQDDWVGQARQLTSEERV